MLEDRGLVLNRNYWQHSVNLHVETRQAKIAFTEQENGLNYNQF